MTHTKILELIENVDVNDSAALDEIDTRVDCMINYKGKQYCGVNNNFYRYKGGDQYEISVSLGDVPQYTRSRDASQAIGKKSVYIWVRRVAFGSVEYFYPEHELYGSMIITGWNKAKCGTENLAYLHGKIQASAHERNEG